jgi:hypothetical protein
MSRTGDPSVFMNISRKSDDVNDVDRPPRASCAASGRVRNRAAPPITGS